ncbi:MAG: hypothetical protein GY717_18800 [Rhodobacteraceae bacterium]|nr:hypothetical protein [Paracoccaceae bacterium]
MLALSGGYYEIIRLDSPAETVISQDRFLTSPRARLMTLRRAAMTRAETDAELASLSQIGGISACAARLIATARAD